MEVFIYKVRFKGFTLQLYCMSCFRPWSWKKKETITAVVHRAGVYITDLDCSSLLDKNNQTGHCSESEVACEPGNDALQLLPSERGPKRPEADWLFCSLCFDPDPNLRRKRKDGVFWNKVIHSHCHTSLTILLIIFLILFLNCQNITTKNSCKCTTTFIMQRENHTGYINKIQAATPTQSLSICF